MNVMIDLETMGTHRKSAIVAIGCVAMDFDKLILGSTFYETIDLEISMAAGLGVNASTIKWWLSQSDEARSELLKAKNHLDETLYRLSWWLRTLDVGEVYPWGNSASFDMGLLADAFNVVGRQVPWNFRNERCYRTMKGEFPQVALPPDVGTAHNALDDATFQAQHLLLIKRWINEHTRG